MCKGIYAECAFPLTLLWYYVPVPYGLDTTLWAGTWKGHEKAAATEVFCCTMLAFALQWSFCHPWSIYGCIFGIPDSGQVPVKLYDKPVSRTTHWSFGLQPTLQGVPGRPLEGHDDAHKRRALDHHCRCWLNTPKMNHLAALDQLLKPMMGNL